MEHTRRISLVVLVSVTCFSLLVTTVYQLQNRRVLLPFSKYVNRSNSIKIDFAVNHPQALHHNASCSPVQSVTHEVKFYTLSSDYFEYRYELNKQHVSVNESRLMLLLTGRNRSCIDWWEFSVGSKTLSTIRSSGYSILAICTTRKDYQISMPLHNNSDVYGIYITLQIWMKEVYFQHYQHYPRLYLLGVSQGSRMASLLCRILPVQAQILYIYSGYRPSLLSRSSHDRRMQNRLSLDPNFANWFYRDYCSKANTRCPFQHPTKRYFSPVPPTYFIHTANDRQSTLASYTRIIADIQRRAFQLRSLLLMDNETMKLSIVLPRNITPSYMSETFDKWLCKPWSSQFLYQHVINSTFEAKERRLRTCWCLNRNFLHFQQHPEITKTWSTSKQVKYADYVKDIKTFTFDLCQEVCGDLLAYHAMLYKYVDKAVAWLDQIDRLRSRYRTQDFLRRPIRLWMYNKADLVDNLQYLTDQTPMKTSCGRHHDANQMYSPEYFLQDWFRFLQKSYPQSHHDLVWSPDPLLADYYIIPHDCACMVAHSYSPDWSEKDYNAFHTLLSDDYFLPLLDNVQRRFPYWNMTLGANHLIAFTLGKNMGIIQDKLTETRLKHAIQLAFTGLRPDLLPTGSPPMYVHRNKTPIYRHHYDIIIPPFDHLQQFSNSSAASQGKGYQQKNTLFFFAGTLNNSISEGSARQRLVSFAREDVGENRRYQNQMTIDKRSFNTMVLIDGAIPVVNYTQLIRASIFHLCLEGFSPWSPRLYESMSQGAIPLILAESIVLPFERFIDWRSFSVKINMNNAKDIIDVMTQVDPFEVYVKQKLENASRYFQAFRWPYSAIDEQHDRHVYLPTEDANGTARNVFHYLSLELRCRRLEQFYGLTVDSFSIRSLIARRLVCRRYPKICPCDDERRSLAVEEYI